jgi:hypothetical protein
MERAPELKNAVLAGTKDCCEVPKFLMSLRGVLLIFSRRTAMISNASWSRAR